MFYPGNPVGGVNQRKQALIKRLASQMGGARGRGAEAGFGGTRTARAPGFFGTLHGFGAAHGAPVSSDRFQGLAQALASYGGGSPFGGPNPNAAPPTDPGFGGGAGGALPAPAGLGTFSGGLRPDATPQTSTFFGPALSQGPTSPVNIQPLIQAQMGPTSPVTTPFLQQLLQSYGGFQAPAPLPTSYTLGRMGVM